MELRHIRYFLAVAEAKSFTRAAEQLQMAQPPLSLQIKDLEKEVGTALFERLPRGVELTEAGRAFFEEVKCLPYFANRGIEMAQRASRGEAGKLRLGVTGTATFNKLASDGLRVFRKRYPDVLLTVVEQGTEPLMELLDKGELDALMVRPLAEQLKGYKSFHLDREPLQIALSRHHPLAQSGEPIPLIALKEEDFIFTPTANCIYQASVEACRRAGFEPRLTRSASLVGSTLLMVAAQLGFALLPASVGLMNRHEIVFRDIDSDIKLPTVPFTLMHCDIQPITTVKNFHAILEELANEHVSEVA
ncbi:LysR substrate-binding domain-containing protein [Pokkaliibacter sp. CJK22405]|uniref:LysR substrate-binding domain-containing protein n=1 Tax=Pokkaliibacter sp. CJK22405 TaxID=3384615 RepID=UPI003984DE0F